MSNLLILLTFLLSTGCATKPDYNLEMRISCNNVKGDDGFSDMSYKELKIYIVGSKCKVIDLIEVR